MDRTNAERQRRYIARLKANSTQPEGVSNAYVDGLQREIAALKTMNRAQAETIDSYQLEDPECRSCGLETRGDLIARIRELERDLEALQKLDLMRLARHIRHAVYGLLGGSSFGGGNIVSAHCPGPSSKT